MFRILTKICRGGYLIGLKIAGGGHRSSASVARSTSCSDCSSRSEGFSGARDSSSDLGFVVELMAGASVCFSSGWSCRGVQKTFITLRSDTKPRWPSGNTLACNAENPGSTPGLDVM